MLGEGVAVHVHTHTHTVQHHNTIKYPLPLYDVFVAKPAVFICFQAKTVKWMMFQKRINDFFLKTIPTLQFCLFLLQKLHV
jgi:hypothetical protein